MDCSMLGFHVLHCLLEFAKTHVHWVNDAVQPSHPVAPFLLLPAIFSNELALHIRCPKYWSSSVSPSNEYSGMISFRIDWFDPLSAQWNLKSHLQHNSKASILHRSAFLMVQLSHPYMTIGKTVALTIQTFVRKVMSLLFNTPSSFVTDFLPRGKCLLISWLQSPSTVILEPNKIKVSHCFHFLPFYLPWSDGTRYHDHSFLNVEF